MSSIKRPKKPQRSGLYQLEVDEWMVAKEAPKKRNKIRKYYPMRVSYSSLEEETYLELADQIIGLDPDGHRMTILTSEGQQEWDQDDDDI